MLLVACGISTASAQLAPSSGGSAPTRPQQVPLSGRNGSLGAVTANQEPAGAAGSSVDTISTTLQVGGTYAGSTLAPDANALRGHPLTIEEVIRRGLQYNLGAGSASRAEQQAIAARKGTRSALLPNLSAQFSENVNKINLATSGFDASSFPGIGQLFPSTVGPFHYYSAQANFSQNVLDIVALRNYATSRRLVEAATLGRADAREQVVLAVTGSYLRVLASTALVHSEEAQVKYTKSVYDQSVSQEDAGAKAHVDVNRNLVQLQTEQQRLTADHASLTKAKMALAREIGLSIDEDFDVSESLSTDAAPEIPLPDAYQRALSNRADLHAAEVQVHASEDARKAASAQRLPTLKIQGFYGLQGVDFNSGKSVYNGGVSVNLPIFNGGQIRSDEQAADVALEQRKSELADAREQVRFDVRSAWIDRDVASQQVIVAKSNRYLAHETLRQSVDRFISGATTSVEVVQSEQTVSSAEHDYIDSLFSLNLAKINLARAMGEAERDIPMVLKGAQ